MRKPVSKHALRRSLERVALQGHIQFSEPVGTVVDRLWHEIEDERFNSNGSRKRAPSRETVRTAPPPEVDSDLT